MTKLKEKLNARKPIFGSMITDLYDPIVIPLLKSKRLDFVVIDMEHGACGLNDLKSFSLAANQTSNASGNAEHELGVIVRPPAGNLDIIPRLMDMGIDGVMVPHVETSDMVRRIIDLVKYPPIGKRGYGMRRSLSKLGVMEPFGSNSTQFLEESNRNTVIFLQIESKLNESEREKIGEIIDSSGCIDGIIIGPSDLSLSMGIFKQFGHKSFENYCSTIQEFCNFRGVNFGIHFSDLDLALKWRKRNATLIIYSNLLKILENGMENDFKRLNRME